MLQDAVATDVRERYRAQVVAPRRRRWRDILERAQQLGMIDAGADLDVAVTMFTGSWYARELAGSPPPRTGRSERPVWWGGPSGAEAATSCPFCALPARPIAKPIEGTRTEPVKPPEPGWRGRARSQDGGGQESAA